MTNLEINNPFDKEISSLILHKEDISEYHLNYLIEDFYIKDGKILSRSDIMDISEKKNNEILSKLSELNIKVSDLEQIEIKNSGEILVSYKKDSQLKQISFDLMNEQNFFKGDLSQQKEKKELEIKEVIKNLEQTDKILQAIDYVLIKNEKEFFGELNNADTLDTDKFGKELQGGSLIYLQNSFKKLFLFIDSIDLNELPEKVKLDILRQKEKYLEIVMGIGDKYEGLAKYLSETKDGFNNLTTELVNNYSISDNLNMLSDFHRKIDENDYQSTTVENSYKLVIGALTTLILEKLKKEDASDEDFLRFAKIITGRGAYNGNYDINSNDWNSTEIDDNLRDQDKSNDAILYVMSRKGGIIEKVNSSNNIENLKIEDEEVKDKKPSEIVNNLRILFNDKFGSESNILMNYNQILENSGYKDILDLGDLEYKDLKYEQKVKVSVLYRVLDKLKGKSYIFNNLLSNDSLEKFAGLFNEVAQGYHKELIENIHKLLGSNNIIYKSFWNGKKARDYSLTGTDAEVFELFQSINGNGLLNFSDNTIEGLKTTGKFVAVLSAGLLAPALILPVGTGLVAYGAAAGLSASIVSMSLNPKGYDSLEESVVDIGSDAVVGTITGAMGGVLAAKFGVVGGQGTMQYIKDIMEVKGSALTGWKNASIFALDLTFLGLVPEAGRMVWIDNKYHDKEILKNKLDK